MKFQEKNWNRKVLNGYFTVEVSFLMSIILCLLIFVIYLSFFLYDRAFLTGVAYQVALEGSRMYDKTADEIENEVEKLANSSVEGKLFACSYEIEVSVSLTKVSVTYDLHVKAPFQALMESSCKSFSADYRVSKSATRISGVTFIRGCQNVERISELLKRGE